jgi:hypothetical protein
MPYIPPCTPQRPLGHGFYLSIVCRAYSPKKSVILGFVIHVLACLQSYVPLQDGFLYVVSLFPYHIILCCSAVCTTAFVISLVPVQHISINHLYPCSVLCEDRLLAVCCVLDMLTTRLMPAQSAFTKINCLLQVYLSFTLLLLSPSTPPVHSFKADIKEQVGRTVLRCYPLRACIAAAD